MHRALYKLFRDGHPTSISGLFALREDIHGDTFGYLASNDISDLTVLVLLSMLVQWKWKNVKQSMKQRTALIVKELLDIEVRFPLSEAERLGLSVTWQRTTNTPYL